MGGPQAIVYLSKDSWAFKDFNNSPVLLAQGSRTGKTVLELKWPLCLHVFQTLNSMWTHCTVLCTQEHLSGDVLPRRGAVFKSHRT